MRVDQLARVFSHSSLRIPISLELEESLKLDAEELPSADVLRRAAPRVGAAADQARLRRAPARQHRRARAGASPATRTRRRCGAISSSCSPTSGSRHVALGSIRRLLWQVDVFGFHLAGIDIRQGAGVVREAASALLPGYAAADEERRVALLSEALVSGRRGIQHDPGGEAGELLRVLDTVALSAEAYGPQAVPAFVISMTEQPSDVLAALWLAQRAGATSLRMVPLFETRAALEEAPATMAELYACEPYVAHLRTQANRQTVMVGYSDSGKDTGLRRLAVGALQRAGAAGGAGGRGRRHARALPRPRRLALARRRAHLPGDPGPARGHGPGPDPDHRAGRDGVRALRRPGAGRAVAGADGLGGAAGQRAAEPADPGRVARGDGAAVGRARASATARSSTTTRSSCASSARSRRSPSCPS